MTTKKSSQKPASTSRRAHRHLTETEVRGFVDAVDPEDNPLAYRILAHLFATCPACRARIGAEIEDLQSSGLLRADFSGSDLELARERRDAPSTFAQLRAAGEAGELRQAGADVVTRGAIEVACLESEKLCASDPTAALEMAGLAIAAAERRRQLSTENRHEQFGPLALAAAHRSNALRVAGRLADAEESMTIAWRLLVAGEESHRRGEQHAADVVGGRDGRSREELALSLLDLDWYGYAGRIADLDVSLQIDRREAAAAGRLVKKYIGLERTACEDGHPPARLWGHQIGRLLTKKARALHEGGDLLGSLAALDEAAAEVPADEFPRLSVCIASCRFWNLLEFGALAKAEKALDELGRLVDRHGTDLDRARLAWSRARFAAESGDRDAARKLLGQAWAAFVSAGCDYDAAVVALELAHEEARNGNHAAVARIAGSLAPLFQAQGIHAEALAALRLFMTAAAAGTANGDLTGAVVGYLRRARRDAALQFSRPEGCARP